MRIIKRYSNRRLYDSESSSIITLKDVAELIKNGEEIQVIDNTTGEDITSKILGQTFLKLNETPENKDLDNFVLKALIQEKISSTQSLVQKLIYAGIGIASIGKDDIERIVSEIIEKGEESQSKQLTNVKDMFNKTSEDLEHLKGQFDEFNKNVKGRIDEFKNSITHTLKNLKTNDVDQLKNEIVKVIDDFSKTFSINKKNK